MIIEHDSSTISFRRSVPARANRTGLIRISLLVAEIEESFFRRSLDAAGSDKRQASVIVLCWLILCIMKSHS
jgi:hypothetical protein